MRPVQLPLDLQFRPAYGRADFLVTGSNKDAVAMIDAWPSSWGGFPALTIFGPAGSGKSHLAAVWANKTDALNLSPTEFTSLETEDIISRGRHVALERLDLLTGDEQLEQKLFHLYNAMNAGKYSLLLTSHIAPAKLDFSLRDLASRLRASSAVEIRQPDDDLFCYVLAKQLHDQGFIVPEKVAKYAVERMERAWPVMDKLVEVLAKRATAEKKGITLPLVRDALLQMEQTHQ